GNAEGGQLGDGGALGEPLDPVVGGVDLEDQRRVLGDRLLVVGHAGAVGGADLGQPRAGGGEQVGEAEPVADLDQLAPADDDLPARRQDGGGEDEGGGVVVDHAGRLRVRDGRPQRTDRAVTALPGPGPGGQVELDVAGSCGGRQGVAG